MLRTLIRSTLALGALAGAFALTTSDALAHGEIRTSTGGRLEVLRYEVKVQIVDQVAVTKVVQIFRNGTGGTVEGTYAFPLPKGAQLTRFAATVGEALREGQMMEQQAAAAAYRAARAAGQEAALATSNTENLYTVSLAKITQSAEPRVELEYIQLLTYDTGMIGYTYPLKSANGAASRAAKFSFHCDVSSLVPVTIAYSNSHTLDIDRGPDAVAAHFDAENYASEKDLHFAYHVKRSTTGIDVRLHRPAGGDGYALIAITPRAELQSEDIIAKDITFVMDVSGSMRGPKIEQAKRALKYCLRTLRPRDRFNIVTFSYGAQRLWSEPRHATRGAVEEGVQVANNLVADGGTNIAAALLESFKDGKTARGATARPHVVVFLTDGKASSGETNPARIIDTATANLGANTRVFTFGIGGDLNEFLLRMMAKRSRGAAAFVRQDHQLELAISTFQQRIASPVLTDLKLTAEGAAIGQIYPKNVSFLFHGDQLLVCARYKGEGPGAIQLTANAGGQTQTFRLPVEFPKVEANGTAIRRLWALKKMSFLLDELKLRGNEKELRDEVIALSLEHTVASPFTAFLVIDPNAPKVDPTSGEPDDEDKNEGGASALRGTLGKLQDLQKQSKSKKGAPGRRARGGRHSGGGAFGGKPSAPTSPSGPTGGATPTGPTGPTSPGTPSPSKGYASGGAPSTNSPAPKPTSRPGNSASGAPRPMDRAPQADAKAEREKLDELASARDARPRGIAAAQAWLARQLVDPKVTLRDRTMIAMALQAGGECRAFGKYAATLGQLCDALTPEAMKGQPIDAWLAAGLVRVDSYGLSGLAGEKRGALALLAGVARMLDANQSSNGGRAVSLALLARQARRAGIALPEAITNALSNMTPPADMKWEESFRYATFVALRSKTAKGYGPRISEALAKLTADTPAEMQLVIALGAAHAKRTFPADRLWTKQKSDGQVEGAIGAVVETSLRVLAANAAYWIGQGPK